MHVIYCAPKIMLLRSCTIHFLSYTIVFLFLLENIVNNYAHHVVHRILKVHINLSTNEKNQHKAKNCVQIFCALKYSIIKKKLHCALFLFDDVVHMSIYPTINCANTGFCAQ